MNFNESITLRTYSDNANKQFNEMQSRLSGIENSFQTRMNGKTMGGLVGAIIGTAFWLAAFLAAFIFVRGLGVVDELLLLICSVVVFALLGFMMIDNIMNISYYGKISGYKNAVSNLQNRVTAGKNSIKSNHDAFMESKSRGWQYALNAASSIPEEATSIESTMNNMESLRAGFINGAKNFLYYTAVVVITITGCVSLFPLASEIITGITSESFDDQMLLIFNVIGLVITGIIEVIIAKAAWGKSDCRVNNVTLLIMVLSPIMFIALIAAVTFLIMLVIAILSILIAILVVVVAGAFIIGCLCGG